MNNWIVTNLKIQYYEKIFSAMGTLLEMVAEEGVGLHFVIKAKKEDDELMMDLDADEVKEIVENWESYD